jgi:mitochondrial ornithine carrier protein
MMNEQNNHSLRNSIKAIYKANSFKGFYSGLGLTLLRVIPQSSILFVSYELIRKQLYHYKDAVTLEKIHKK